MDTTSELKTLQRILFRRGEQALAGIALRAQTRIELLERVADAIGPARKATAKFIIHLDGKRNADEYWKLRTAAEEAHGELNDALAALKKHGRPRT